MRDPQRHLEHLLPAHRSHRHHGRGLARRDQDPARSLEALPSLLYVLHPPPFPNPCFHEAHTNCHITGYSTLAGFCEPAESVEEAVRREVWEEAGVHLGRVVVHSTQPWPYPANLMIGAIGQTVPGQEDIQLKHDPELEDAKWVSFDEVREALRIGTSGIGEPAGPQYKEGGLRLPPRTAIANRLLTAVVEEGFLGAVTKM